LTITVKSGEKFTQSITSDCLSRLEDHKKIDFDEGVIRDVSGTMFGGKYFLVLAQDPSVSDK